MFLGKLWIDEMEDHKLDSKSGAYGLICIKPIRPDIDFQFVVLINSFLETHLSCRLLTKAAGSWF